MGDRRAEIEQRAASFPIDVLDLETMRAAGRLQELAAPFADGIEAALATMPIAQLVAMCDEFVVCIDGMLGEGAARAILGPRTRVDELGWALEAVLGRYRAQVGVVDEAVSDLTETVPED